MKRTIIILFISSAIFFLSCTKDVERTSVIGTWKCIEVGTLTAPNPYFVDIQYDYNDTTRLIISNFYNIGHSLDVIASLDGYDITIPSQIVGGYGFTGQGRVSSNYKEIEWEYEADDGSGMIDDVDAIYSRN